MGETRRHLAPGASGSLRSLGTAHAMLVMALVVLLLIAGTLAPGLLAPAHLLEMLRQSVPLVLTALGQSSVIITGGIDISVGEIVTMSNIVSTNLMRGSDEAALFAALVVLGLGALSGATSGGIIAFTRVPPLVVTFGMAFIVRGGYLLYSGGTPKGYASPVIRALGTGRWGGIPVSLLLAGAVILVLFALDRRSVWRRSIPYLGSNVQAAFYSGIPVRSRIVAVYAFSGLMASLAGLLLTGYIGVGNFDIGGEPYMMNSIAASVIGGNTFDGAGSLSGTVLGSLIMTVLASIMTSLGLGEAGKQVVQGVIILAMVSLYILRARAQA